MRLPDPQGSYAVLIGTAVYRSRELTDLPAVRNNLKGLAEVLTDARLGGLASDHCVVLPDPIDVRTIYRTLRQYAGTAEDTLLVYFAGHGFTTPVRNELYLGLSDTDPEALRVSALPFDVIREVLGECPAKNRVLILDCCYSGRVTEEYMSGADEVILGQLDIEGTYILTSAPATSIALAPAGAAYTAFTGELLSLLRRGVPGGPELLTFATIYRQVLLTMTTRRLPRPGRRGTGTVDQLALTRNVAYTANPQTVSVADPAPHHPWPPNVSPAHGVEFEASKKTKLTMTTWAMVLGLAGIIYCSFAIYGVSAEGVATGLDVVRVVFIVVIVLICLMLCVYAAFVALNTPPLKRITKYMTTKKFVTIVVIVVALCFATVLFPREPLFAQRREPLSVPRYENRTLYSNFTSFPDLKSWTQLVDEAHAIQDFSEKQGPFTIFAPTDSAFAKLPSNTLQDLGKPENFMKAVHYKNNHVILTSLPSSTFRDGMQIATLDASIVTMHKRNGDWYINDAKILQIDIPSQNGIIHTIDTVLVPANQ